MKRVVFFSLFVTTSILLTSCADALRPEQLAKVEQMQNQIDSLEQVILNHPLDSAAMKAQEAEIVERRIKNNYFPDTIDKALAQKMNRFKVMRRSLAPLGYDFINLKNGFREMRMSLDNLYSDIDNGHNERDKYDEFIRFEQSKLEQLRALSDEYLKARQENLQTFDELFPELEAFSKDLAKKAKNRQ